MILIVLVFLEYVDLLNLRDYIVFVYIAINALYKRIFRDDHQANIIVA